MNGILSYFRSNVILFFVITVLLQLVPKGNLQKYIQFFTSLLLVFGVFYPVLNSMGKSDDFLEKIQYESFLQQLEEISLDAEKIVYVSNDSYIQKYEDAIALDITQMAEEENFAVKEIEVKMTETYQIDRIYMRVKNQAKEDILIGKVVLGDDTNEEKKAEDGAYRKLKEKLINYYQLSEGQLDIVCG